MGTFNLDEFFATLRDLKDTVLEKFDKEDDKRELELVRMRYDSDRENAYNKLESEQKSTIAYLSLFSICAVIISLAFMQGGGFFDAKLCNIVSLTIVVFLLTLNTLCIINTLKKLNDFRYTNTYGKYLITDDWYLEIDDCLVDIKGEDIDLEATYILGINYGKKFEISKEQYLTLDMLDEKEVITIDLYKTHEID